MHSKEFYIKDQCGVGGNDTAGAAWAVAKAGGDGQFSFAADFHGGDPFIPSLNHLTHSEGKFKELTAIYRAVKLGSVGEPSGVVDLHGLSRLGGGAGSRHHLYILKPRGGCHPWRVLRGSS